MSIVAIDRIRIRRHSESEKMSPFRPWLPMTFQSTSFIANHFALPKAKHLMLAYSSWIQRMFTDHSIDEPSALLPERSVVLGYRQCCLGQQRAHRCANRPA